MKTVPTLLVLLASASLSFAEPAIANTPAVMLSQQKAVEKYPSLSIAGSEMNAAFAATYQFWKQWKPTELQKDNWPELIAAQVAADLAKKEMERRAEIARRNHTTTTSTSDVTVHTK